MGWHQKNPRPYVTREPREEWVSRKGVRTRTQRNAALRQYTRIEYPSIRVSEQGRVSSLFCVSSSGDVGSKVCVTIRSDDTHTHTPTHNVPTTPTPGTSERLIPPLCRRRRLRRLRQTRTSLVTTVPGCSDVNNKHIAKANSESEWPRTQHRAVSRWRDS